MSHEIRTPMNGIVGMTDLLSETDLDNGQLSMVQTIGSCGESLIVILNDILDITQIQSGKLKLQTDNFNLNNALNEVIRLYQPNAERKSQSINLKCESQNDIWVRGDKTRINQVVSNLISNAVKYTEKGSISILLEVATAKPGIFDIQVTVKDPGVGISEQNLSKLFQPFTKVASHCTTSVHSSGLGLSISKRLVEIMGGTIGARSKLGKGSEFYFNLTLKKGFPSLLMKKNLASLQLRSKHGITRSTFLHELKVMVAEDDMVNRHVMKGLLTKIGVKCTFAENGVEVLDKVKTDDFDLILMDCQMPRMDGFEATKCIREMKKKIKQPVIIATTASVMREERERCISSGMNYILSKPLKTAHLERTLKRFF